MDAVETGSMMQGSIMTGSMMQGSMMPGSMMHGSMIHGSMPGSMHAPSQGGSHMSSGSSFMTQKGSRIKNDSPISRHNSSSSRYSSRNNSSSMRKPSPSGSGSNRGSPAGVCSRSPTPHDRGGSARQESPAGRRHSVPRVRFGKSRKKLALLAIDLNLT